MRTWRVCPHVPPIMYTTARNTGQEASYISKPVPWLDRWLPSKRWSPVGRSADCRALWGRAVWLLRGVDPGSFFVYGSGTRGPIHSRIRFWSLSRGRRIPKRAFWEFCPRRTGNLLAGFQDCRWCLGPLTLLLQFKYLYFYLIGLYSLLDLGLASHSFHYPLSQAHIK